MVLEIYVTFLDAVFKWCCGVWSPLSIRNCNSAWKFPLACLVKRDMADVNSVSGVLFNLSSLFEFRPDWTPNETHGKQNAPSRNTESASHGNLFSQPLTKWPLEFEHSTDTGNQIAYPVSDTFSVNLSLSWSEYELISLKTKARFKRRTLHVPNLMQMSENNRFFSFALDSAHEKFDVWNGP